MIARILAVFFILLSALKALSAPTDGSQFEPLKSYQINLNETTISGVSSGAYMAVQMQIAYSDLIAGAASFAGGPYGCSKGEVGQARLICMSHPEKVNVVELIDAAMKFEQLGEISPLHNLKNKKLFIFQSPKDSVNKPVSSEKLYELAEKLFLVNHVVFENKVESAHGFPTLDQGQSCDLPVKPWILKCQYDGAGEALRALGLNLQTRGAAKPENLLPFSQVEFSVPESRMASQGWIYVPTDCQNHGLCRLHMALHGCQMSGEDIQNEFALKAGYNEWAEANKVIVVYPQASKSGNGNPYGCWDWFGLTGPHYATKLGPQMQALRKIIGRLGGEN